MLVATAAQNGGARPISEQHTGVPVLPIHNGRKFFSADHEHGIIRARGDKLLADLHANQKTGTGRLHVKSRRALGAELMLDDAGGRRERHVRRNRGTNDQVNFISGNPGLFQSPAGCFHRQIRGTHGVRRQPAFFDAGPGGNPFIGGVHHLLQISVGHHAVRYIRAGADDVDRPRRSLGAGAVQLGLVGVGHSTS